VGTRVPARTHLCVCVYTCEVLIGSVGGGVRRNNPLAKHRNINQHQSLERGPLAPTLRYCLHLHSTRKKIMADAMDIEQRLHVHVPTFARESFAGNSPRNLIIFV